MRALAHLGIHILYTCFMPNSRYLEQFKKCARTLTNPYVIRKIMPLLKAQNASISEKRLLVPTEVHITPRTEHSNLKDVLTMRGMSQDLKGQNNEFVMSSKDNFIRN